MALMVDCETLGTDPDCVVLTIGAVIFNPKGDGVTHRFSVKPSVDEQLALGRTVSDDTMAWWANQSKAAQDEAFSDHDRVPFKEAMQQLHKFCWNIDQPWSHGAPFDIVLMEHCWRQNQMTAPWKFWNVRDTRTLFDVTGVNLKDGGHVTTHRAVEDAEHQAIIVQKAYKKLMAAGLVKL
jgi:hypothetical protein